jgi:hypothetical protein
MVKLNRSYAPSRSSDCLYSAVTSDMVCQLSMVNLAETRFLNAMLATVTAPIRL